MSTLIDLTGQKFGKLTVIKKGKSQNHKIYWVCKCDCGNEVDVLGANLRKGATKSCGCYNKEKVGQRSKKDVTGKKFGLLTALEPTEERYYQSVVWKCQCDCGNIINASLDSLQKGDKLSCGCLKESYGVRQIKNLLNEANIPYAVEQTFQDCIFPETNSLLRFDFYIDDRYLIEYDGEQHYYATGGALTWNTPAHLEKVQKRDKFKNNWCKKHNIPLIRIPYTQKIIQLEDILLETSKYKINED